MAKRGVCGRLVRTCVTGVGFAGVVACSPAVDIDESAHEVETLGEAIINGTNVSNTQLGAVAIYTGYVRPCSGTLIRRQWVLTARHCLSTDGKRQGPPLPAGDITVVQALNPGLTLPSSGGRAVTQIIRHPSLDLALVKISSPLSGGMPLWNGNHADLPGKTVRAMGFGRFVDTLDGDVENGTTGAGRLRMADLLVTEFQDEGECSLDTCFKLRSNASGQLTAGGDSGGPSYLMTDALGRSLPAVAGVHRKSAGGSPGPTNTRIADDVSVAAARAWIKRRIYPAGSHTGLSRADLALVGGSGWVTLPVARSNGDGTFVVTSENVGDYAAWAQASSAQAVPGDFNGDKRTDIAITGGAGWSSIPLALSNGNGTFTIKNSSLGNFPSWAAGPGVKAIPGDFNGDGRGDIALVGGAGWSTIPMALSNGDGTFMVTNSSVSLFPAWATTAGARAVGGDFDGDGREDIALVGGVGWSNIRIAYSLGNSFFDVRTANVGSTFSSRAANAAAKAVAGDFNGDGRDDIALVGVSGWTTIPIAFPIGNSHFANSNKTMADFPGWSAQSGVEPVSGDYDGDLVDDIALLGGNGWTTVPVAFSNADGTFAKTNEPVDGFALWAGNTSAKPVSGH